jgi:hypothetical protein
MVWPSRAFLQEIDMPDADSGAVNAENTPKTPEFPEQASQAPQPGIERIEKAGKMGWRFTDGAILWDDGEKEVPTSGLSDEQKRLDARLAAGEVYGVSKPGVSDGEFTALQAAHASLPPPEQILASRKAEAKKRAGQKPEPDKPLPPTEVELNQALRRRTHQLLEREIDRLEELKSLSIAGTVVLTRDGLDLGPRNPPMELHTAVLGYLRIADQGNPQQMLKALQEARGWQAKS